MSVLRVTKRRFDTTLAEPLYLPREPVAHPELPRRPTRSLFRSVGLTVKTTHKAISDLDCTERNDGDIVRHANLCPYQDHGRSLI